MSAEMIIATFLLVCLGCFFSVNIHNVLRTHKPKGTSEPHAEIEEPSGLVVGMAVLGTFVYFAEAFLYPLLVFTGLFSAVGFLFVNEVSFMLYVRIIGAVLTAAGYFLFIWSVIVRGRYATSWAMRNGHRLVTWGPYRCVRHPSYLAYFLMFFGLFALWPNPFTLIPLVAIPGYFRVTLQEEKLLMLRFGKEYEEYRKKTGRFIPRL